MTQLKHAGDRTGRRQHLLDWTPLALLCVLAACGEVPTSSEQPAKAAVRQNPPATEDADRKDTPWQRMSDEELAAAIGRVQGRVLIGFKDSAAVGGVDNSGRVIASAEAVRNGRALVERLGGTVQYEFKRIPAVAATISSALVSELRKNPLVDYLEASAAGSWDTQVTPWNIDTVRATNVRSYSTGYGVKTIIIDSGIDIYHQDLYSRVAFRCVNSSEPLVDNVGHGTHVAGIAAALDNTVDVVGVAPDLFLWSSNVAMSGAPDAAEVACSIDVARLNSVRVANMSFSLITSTAVTDEINGGYNYDNLLFVGSAGNSYGGAVSYPASLANVIAVSSINQDKSLSSFSSVGAKVELTAPGNNILSLAWTGGYVCASGGSTATCSGTSMAAPHVTGAAALIMAYNSSWTNAQVRSHLNSTATDLGSSGRDNSFGYGLINLAAAIP